MHYSPETEKKGLLMERTPKNYDGTQTTNKHIKQLLPGVLEKLGKNYKDQGSLVIAAWTEVIGDNLAPMTRAISFENGTLTVQVKNSTLHSLLSGQEKERLLSLLKEKFPFTNIQKIVFRRI